MGGSQDKQKIFRENTFCVEQAGSQQIIGCIKA